MESIRTAILVGLGQKVQRIQLESGEQIQIIHVNDGRSAIEEIMARPPQLVMVDASLDGASSGDYPDFILDGFPDFRSPIIIVKLELPNPGLIIHEWNASNGNFKTRTAPPEQLRPEIERYYSRPPQAARRADDTHPEIRNIGYNDNVDRGKRAFHVQTEVSGEDKIKIKTTILEGGTVIDSFVQNCLQPQDDIVGPMKVAESQHHSALAKVKSGNYD